MMIHFVGMFTRVEGFYIGVIPLGNALRERGLSP